MMALGSSVVNIKITCVYFELEFMMVRKLNEKTPCARCSNGRAAVLQVQGPKFKPQYHQNQKMKMKTSG
jgi:hypothetical protein